MSHPIIECVDAIGAALKDVADVNPTFMATADKAAALKGLAVTKAQLAELELRVLAVASDVAEETAARDVAAWLHHQTRGRFEDARAEHQLAVALDKRYDAVAAAMREGACNTAQAHVVTQALDELSDDVPAETLALAEQTLVGYCEKFDPAQLRRLGRRILDVVAPEIAEAAEARRLQDEEAHARAKTRLTLRPLGDGTTRLSGLIPDATAHRLATYLQAFTNPRKDLTQEPDKVARLPFPRRLGEAFCQLLESVDPARLPVHGGDATTVLVTISLDALRAELGVGEVIGGDAMSAAEVRRLACTAKVIPIVLGGQGQTLDLGRGRRLLEGVQRKALLLRDKTCRAEGCDIPGTWCEAHHQIPWSQGGSTDLTNAVLLCSHHHHRAHDLQWQADRLPNGDVRFNRRR